MLPGEFLTDELENVKRILQDTLRHEYAPELTQDYFLECEERLNRISRNARKIESAKIDQVRAVKGLLSELSDLARWIFFIERSHLGEFSWPFADEVRRIADLLLSTPSVNGSTKPITHFVADGEGYWIFDEGQFSAIEGLNRFIVVAFPRSLKHHVLLHTIFGHELGHAALYTGGNVSNLQTRLLKELTCSGRLRTADSMRDWLTAGDIPEGLRDHYDASEVPFNPHSVPHTWWLIELMCDLFGLLLFGPGFLAAHRTILRPRNPSGYEFELSEPSHPPYAVRHRMLVQAMRRLKWDKPQMSNFDGAAESLFLRYVLDDDYGPWATVFEDDQIDGALCEISATLGELGSLEYELPTGEVLGVLIKRIVDGIPPLLEEISGDGVPTHRLVPISQILHAGWIAWLGRSELFGSKGAEPPKDFFFLNNRLCDYALLQQKGINPGLN